MMKRELRRGVLATRRSLPSEEIAVRSQNIQGRLGLLPPFENAAVVFFYVALPDEVQTRGLISAALARGKRVAVPVVEEGAVQLVAIEVTSVDFKSRTGSLGFSEPVKGTDSPLAAELIDLVVVPGVAFDPGGGRMGFGKGYYDRFLSRCRLVTTFVGVAFECQLVGEVPLGVHDILMDYIITEDRVICCS